MSTQAFFAKLSREVTEDIHEARDLITAHVEEAEGSVTFRGILPPTERRQEWVAFFEKQAAGDEEYESEGLDPALEPFENMSDDSEPPVTDEAGYDEEEPEAPADLGSLVDQLQGLVDQIREALPGGDEEAPEEGPEELLEEIPSDIPNELTPDEMGNPAMDEFKIPLAKTLRITAPRDEELSDAKSALSSIEANFKGHKVLSLRLAGNTWHAELEKPEVSVEKR